MKNAALAGWIVCMGLMLAAPAQASVDEDMLAKLSLERPESLTHAEAENLLFKLTDTSAAVRAWAAELLLSRSNPYQVSAVWILVHDPSPILQQVAFNYVQIECNSRTHLCEPMVRFLLKSRDRETVAWARFELFQYAPEKDLKNAPRGFILDLLSQLSGGLDANRSDRSRNLLERLNQHVDLEVRETAQRALNYLEP